MTRTQPRGPAPSVIDPPLNHLAHRPRARYSLEVVWGFASSGADRSCRCTFYVFDSATGEEVRRWPSVTLTAAKANRAEHVALVRALNAEDAA